MFLEEYSDKERNAVFEDGANPKLSRLSHSFNNPYWSYQYHLHKEETELVFISDGAGVYNINTNSYSLKKGSILIVEKGAIHSLSSSEDSPLSCWTCAISDYKLLDMPERGYMLPANLSPCLEAGIHEDSIHMLFEELKYFAECKTKTSLATCDMLASALASIYYEIFRSMPKAERHEAPTFVRDILIYINENYTSPISLKQLSQIFHISSDHISHEFSRVYGISPINYVIDRRLNEAKWMLINTEDSLTSISHKVGYENTWHFSNLFQKRLKYPPLKFRELYRYNKEIKETKNSHES